MVHATALPRDAAKPPRARSRAITERTRQRYLQQYAIDAESDCWVWTGTIEQGTGYGSASNLKAHRLFYEHHVGPIPDGLVLDHLCRNRACVNPAHLEAVQQRTNVLRGIGVIATNAVKTVCAHGHSLAPDNVYIGNNGRRRCKECHARYACEAAARRRAR